MAPLNIARKIVRYFLTHLRVFEKCLSSLKAHFYLKGSKDLGLPIFEFQRVQEELKLPT